MPQFITTASGTQLAYEHRPGTSPGIVFLGGFRSDMTGSKAMALDMLCADVGIQYTRFDYMGHGQSSGAFEDGSIGEWASNAVTVIDKVTTGPQVLVGSSMGGWLMVLAALARKERVRGLVGIAAAPDFTIDLMWKNFSEKQRHEVETQGRTLRYSEMEQGYYPITKRFLEDSKNHLVMAGPIALDVPVTLLHGMADVDVPWQISLNLAQKLETTDLRVHLIKDGDHRLSEPDNLLTLTYAVTDILARAGE